MADEYSEKIVHSSKNEANGILGTRDGSRVTEDVNNEKDIMDHGREGSYDVAVSKNGFKLHPQPTTDPLDPLNWTSFRKHIILTIVMYL